MSAPTGVEPHSLAAESAVLGAMIESAEAVAAALPRLTAAMFYTDAHRVIFDRIASMHASHEPVDSLLLAEALRQVGELDAVGGPAKLAALVHDGAINPHLPRYIALVRAAADKRAVIRVLTARLDEARNGRPATAQDLVTATTDALHAIGVAAAEEAPGPKALIGGAIGTAVVTETPWLVEGLFSEPDQHLIVGSSSGAKTWLLADLCLAVSHPGIATYLGQPIRRHGRVCLESWEQGQTEDLRRLHKLARGHGLPIASAFESLILLSETPGTLNDESYFTKRLRELIEWGVVLYGVDSLSEGAGIELNDNTAYTDWRRARIRPILDAGISVVMTHLTGHVKPGVGRTREAVVRNATQIRALSSNVLEGRQLGETTFKLHHNKHRNSTGLPLGTLELVGTMADPFVELRLTAPAATVPPATKEALARRLLLALGARDPDAWLTRKAIESALNDPDAATRIDPKERVSKRAWEPALDALVAEGGFELGKLRQADAWRLKTAEPVFEQCSSSFQPDSDEDEDEA